MTRVLIGAVVLSAVTNGLLAQSADRKRPDASKTGFAPERLTRIHLRLKDFVDGGTIAGAVTLVARHGAVVSLDAVGYQDLETKTLMRTNSIFQIRSMTKPITAVGIMILLEEGRLRFGDPVSKYVPEFGDLMLVDSRDGQKILTTKKPSRTVTIRDLLTHTSGLSEVPERKESSATLAESMSLISQVPLEFAPGSKFLYSNAGYETLGRIIEVVSGRFYEEFVERRILRPLGMTASFFFSPPDACHRIASHYEPQNGTLKRFQGSLNPDWQSPAGCRSFAASVRYPGPSWGMFSTASNVAVFHQMLLNGGTYKGVRILSRGSVEIMTASHTGDLTAGRASAYGLGWFVQPRGDRLGFLSPRTYFHSGLRGTFGWVDPQNDSIGILMIQLEPGEGQDSVRQTFIAMTYAAMADD